MGFIFDFLYEHWPEFQNWVMRREDRYYDAGFNKGYQVKKTV